MMNEMKRGVYTNTNTDEVVEFGYKTDISVTNKIKFISHVVDTVVGAHYYPLIRDLVFDYVVIRYFTDIEFDEDLSVDAIEQLIKTTNIADIVKMNMAQGLLDELNQAVNLDIEYKTGIRVNRVEDAIYKLIRVATNKIDNVNIAETMELAKKLGGMTGEFTPEKIMDAYANSDLFKQRMQESKREKEQQRITSGGLRVIE